MEGVSKLFSLLIQCPNLCDEPQAIEAMLEMSHELLQHPSRQQFPLQTILPILTLLASVVQKWEKQGYVCLTSDILTSTMFQRNIMRSERPLSLYLSQRLSRLVGGSNRVLILHLQSGTNTPLSDARLLVIWPLRHRNMLLQRLHLMQCTTCPVY
jgi:hypothetical protein